MKKSLFHIVFGCLVIVLFFGCSSSDEKANKLFVKATQHVKSAQETEVKSYSDALKFYKDALEKAEEIISKYPSSQVAVRLSQKKVDSGSYTITDFRHFVADTNLKADAEEDPLACALFVANGTKDTNKSFALARIAGQYARTRQYDKALKAANSTKKAVDKASALARIAEQYAEAGETDKASKILSQALREAKKIKSDYNKTINLGGIAAIYSKVGQNDKASEILSQSFHLAETIYGVNKNSRALSSIARNYAKLGDYDKAFQVVKKIIKVRIKVMSLVHITEQYAKAGDYDSAFKVVNKIKNSNYKINVFAQLAGGYSDKPLQVAEINYYKVKALSSIADSYAEAGNHDKALEILSQVVTNAGDDASLLIKTANSYAKVERKDKALEILSKVFKNAGNNGNISVRLAEGYVKVGQKDKASEILSQVLQILQAEEKVDDWEKAWGLAQIGACYAKAGKKVDDKARKILHEIIREIDQKKNK